MSYCKKVAFWQGSLFIFLAVSNALSDHSPGWKIGLVTASSVLAVVVIVGWLWRDRREPPPRGSARE
ncbi:hypothetical protein [Arthrobacter woluwensis]|uniref:Uncharacterized protein n=1 Tax=Arthrobacter woluwensis TaxID=156980 RepID=A0A1H4NDR7_9MICC|nr:hypothetical protein [Arthrobacter woluwensis]SEB93264.1 hypothetical protein SAMN04489745_1632 [Arthrobacter woluwensis]